MRSFIHASPRLHTITAETAADYEEVIYRRQLMCWSIALFAISFWFASLFFQSQTNNWHGNSHRDHSAFFIASPSEWEVVRKRVEAKRLARAAAEHGPIAVVAQRTVSRSSQTGNLRFADRSHAVK